MKNILKSILLLLVSAVPSWGIGFYEAASAGHIAWSGSSSSGYSQTRITVRNTRSYSVDVDFCTASFVQANTSQRIGLAYETTTGGYYLRLSAGATYTLTFSSRCLDQSRSSPASGVSFASCSNISSFTTIVNALRSNYTQSSVWSITDNSNISAAWKAADSRSTVTPPPPTAPRIDLTGSWSSRISGSNLVITAGRVDNNGNTSSGTLRLRVFASRTKYTGNSTLNGYVMGTTSLGQFSARSYMSNISRTVSFTRPPSGTYWTVMVLEDYGKSSSTFSL